MNTSAVIVAALPALLIVGAILAPMLARRGRSRRFRDRAAQPGGRDKKAQPELHERWNDLEGFNTDPLSAGKGDRYFADWAALQDKFVDPSGDSTAEAGNLITEGVRRRA